MHKKWLIFVAAAGLFSGLQGCGSSTRVSGSVTYKGQPVGNGNIVFRPEDGKGPIVGEKITDGRYRIDAITPGPKRVEIIGVKKIDFARSQGEMAEAAKDRANRGDKSGIVERADVIPPDAKGNNEVVEVPPGQSVRDFALEPPVPAGEKKAN